MNRRPSYVDQLIAMAVLVALVAFSLIRVQIVDVPWHLATARLARALGHWPTRNTFSYTFPDHPIYQQYPAFQATLYALYQRWGWGALSVLTCAGWSAVFLMFVRWAGPWRAAALRPLLWVVGLYALQRRMVLRPDLFSMLALGAMLLALDAHRRRWRWAIAAVPLLHLFWANSHQLFPLSLVVQGLFVAHLVVSRRGGWSADREDAAVPIWPAALALLASVGLSFATPLGLDVVRVSAQTAESLSRMRDQVQEFRRIWEQPYELVLALATGLPAAFVLWRGRKLWSPFDAGLWLMSAALAVSAVRGLMFFGIVSAAVAQRAILRCDAAGLTIFPAVRPVVGRILRIEAAVLAVALSAGAVHKRWIHPPLALGGTQPGVGRSLGGWADEAIAFLRANPPPGRMMNMSWASGNALIWDLPNHPVFVDPRFESYPHDFLRQVADAYRDDGRLSGLIDRYGPSWIFGEHFRDGVRDRLVALVRRGWEPVYLDSAHVILVRSGADTEAYRAAHRIDPARVHPGDLLPGPPALRAEQISQFTQFVRALGSGSAK